MSGHSVVIDVEEAKRIGRDAARYRWLRENFLRDIHHRLTWYLPWGTPMTPEGLDENIDAEISRIKGSP